MKMHIRAVLTVMAQESRVGEDELEAVVKQAVLVQR